MDEDSADGARSLYLKQRDLSVFTFGQPSVGSQADRIHELLRSSWTSSYSAGNRPHRLRSVSARTPASAQGGTKARNPFLFYRYLVVQKGEPGLDSMKESYRSPFVRPTPCLGATYLHPSDPYQLAGAGEDFRSPHLRFREQARISAIPKPYHRSGALGSQGYHDLGEGPTTMGILCPALPTAHVVAGRGWG